MNVTKYTNYFRKLAISHKDLLHNPLSETGDADVGEKHFGRYGAEEVISGLRTKISWPALLIEMYETKTSSDTPIVVRGKYFGAFTVLATAGLENINEQETAYELTERIIYDTLAQIWQDHYGVNADACKSSFNQFDFNSLVITPVGPVFDAQYGWRCEFEFNFNNTPQITTAPAAGIFK